MWHSHSWLCSWVGLCSGRRPRRAPFPSFPIPQKTRITQKIRAGEVKDPGPPEVATTGLFEAAGGGAGNVGRRGERVAGNHRVAELAEKIADGAGGMRD